MQTIEEVPRPFDDVCRRSLRRPPGPCRGPTIHDPRESQRPERTILIGFTGRRRPPEVRASLDELARLVDTAGAAVVGELVQKRGGPTPSTLLSKGKVEELKGLVAQTAADTVACDDDLSPAQVRNLEKTLERKVVDRSEVILSIFARHARGIG